MNPLAQRLPVMSNDSAAILAAITSSLFDSLKGSSINLFTLSGSRNFNFGLAAPGLAKAVFAFQQSHGRVPNQLFNDGLLPSLKPQLQATGNLQRLVMFRDFTVNMDRYTYVPEEAGLGAYGFNAPILAAKVVTKPDAVYSFDIVTVTNRDSGEGYTTRVNLPMGGKAFNGRYYEIPGYVSDRPGDGWISFDDIAYGCFQNWGVILIAFSKPEYVFATDEGFMLTVEGIKYLEKSLAYWSNMYSPWPGWPRTDLINGDVMIGMPIPILAQLKVLRDQQIAAGSTAASLVQLLTIALSFYGAYFGASGISGLVSGSYTLANLQSTIWLAGQLGIKVSPVAGIGLKVLGGQFIPDGVVANPINSMIPDVSDIDDPALWDDAFAELDNWNNALIDFSADVEVMLDTAVDVAPDILQTDIATLGDDYVVALDPVLPPIVIDDITDNTPDNSGVTPSNELQLPDESEIAAMADSTGPMSLDQFNTIFDVPDDTASVAAEILEYTDGVQSDSPATTGDQAGFASENVPAISQNWDVSTLADAAKVLLAYSQYQNAVRLNNTRDDSVPEGQPIQPMAPPPPVPIPVVTPGGDTVYVNPDGSVTDGKSSKLLLYVGLGLMLLTVR